MQKVAKIVLSGELANSKPFGLLLKGFLYVYKLIYKKMDF